MKEEQAFTIENNRHLQLKTIQIRNFSKIQSKIFENYFFENIATFSYRGSQTLSSDMRIIILLSIMEE